MQSYCKNRQSMATQNCQVQQLADQSPEDAWIIEVLNKRNEWARFSPDDSSDIFIVGGASCDSEIVPPPFTI
ncbi:hypothetical protein PAPYR_140 [Paratrimastix pyriformis]|uniref:Uncharacterized protein n=1 Tax=Paratrimastix pyriformis TaxID=342808 RepID=A0ABQ8UWS5_9EUKA|nr:hypothetical protein PAPYR_140 [Paratrimastix pyriformis]